VVAGSQAVPGEATTVIPRYYFLPLTEENQPSWDLDGLRRRSELLFGSSHRLPIAVLAATAERHQLYARRIAQEAGVGDKESVRILGDLEEAHLLEPDEPPDQRLGRGRPPRYLWRTDDVFWGCVLALGERFRRQPPGSA